MAEPIDQGSTGASPFISRFVDVLHEDIRINIDDAFQRAHYTVTYRIKSDTTGQQIPLLFYAADLAGEMTVMLDGEFVAVDKVDEGFSNYNYTDDGSFRCYFDPNYNSTQFTRLPESPMRRYHTNYTYFRYFVVDLAEGEHEIIVNYSATPWVDRWEPVKEYSFRYALAPAKYWRSFGTLDVTVEREDSSQVLTTNLDTTAILHRGAIATWSFQSLPTDIMEIRWQPELGWFKTGMLNSGTWVLTLAFLLLLLWIQLKLIRSENRWVNGIFSFFAAVSLIVFWLFSIGIVDTIVGEHASATHGYVVMVIFLFPVIWLVYGVIFWINREAQLES